ncbi:hypothetical protein BDW74DRAFT_190269 [Aspergillus multicolor]|uniref:uncharacterized protein n=1 Tax=Aspergillus multicolor TaxID=41759 RepID=UPI003CCE1D14
MPPVSVAHPGSQHPPSTQSQRPAIQQPLTTQAFANLVDQIRSIASGSDFQTAEEIFVEVASLRSQLDSKEKELEHVKNEMSKQVTAKQIAIDEMFKENGVQRSKRKEATTEIERLNKLVQEGKDSISQKQREISNVKGKHQELESDKAQLKSNLGSAQRDIDGLQLKVKEKDILIDRMKSSHSENQERLKDVEESARNMEKEKAALKTSLQAARARVEEIENYATQQFDSDEDSMADAFNDLWQYAITEIYSHLVRDLSEEVLQNRAVWETFRRLSNLAVEHHVPLPHSNSLAAKQMRLAIFLAILAREVDKQIFQPTYIVPEDAGIRKVLADLAAYDNQRESFYRSILLSIDPDAQNADLQSRIQAVIRNASSYLYDMLPNDQFDQLRTSVEKIVKKAIEIWHPLQHSLQRYEPDFEPLKWEDDKWSPLEFPEGGHAGSETSPDVFDENLLTVFPRLTVVEKGHRFPLTDVIQLRRSQPQCMAAGREVSNVPTRPVINRVTSTRSRRKSIASSNAGPANSTLLSKKKSPGA